MSAARTAMAAARSFLFVPGDRLARLPKALDAGAHLVIVDLEDAVAAGDKGRARDALAQEWLTLAPEQRQRLAVRVNAAGTQWHEADLRMVAALAGQGLAGAMLPKAESVAMLAAVAQAAPALPLLPLIESAQGLRAIDAIATAPGVARIAFGHLDFQADLGMQSAEDERELDAVRLALVIASRLGGLPAPVDGVTVALDSEPRLQADIARSRRLGFSGKLCIHPKQVASVNELMGPTPAQKDWARRVMEASAVHGTGAFRLDGEMVDAPVLQRAQRYLAAP